MQFFMIQSEGLFARPSGSRCEIRGADAFYSKFRARDRPRDRPNVALASAQPAFAQSNANSYCVAAVLLADDGAYEAEGRRCISTALRALMYRLSGVFPAILIPDRQHCGGGE